MAKPMMKSSSRPKRSRYTSAVVALVLSFQLIRFFLAVPAAYVICWDEETRSHGLVAIADHRATEHELESTPAGKDTGFSFEHCKDTYAGFDLTPVQPLGLPTAVVHVILARSAPDSVFTAAAVPEYLLRLPFQPPRVRS